MTTIPNSDETEAHLEVVQSGWTAKTVLTPNDGVTWRHRCPEHSDSEVTRSERERLAREIESRYLGPDSGRLPDGRDAPDARLRHAYDEGLELAARIVRGDL